MDYIQAALQIAVLLSVWAARQMLKSYVPKYLEKKGENLATKEDVGAITRLVEHARLEYLEKLEKVKFGYSSDSALLERRRTLYQEVAANLAHQLANRAPAGGSRESLLSRYATLWLWAPDEVISKVNAFLDTQRRSVERPGAVDPTELRQKYAECLIAMRRDSGFAETVITAASYTQPTF